MRPPSLRIEAPFVLKTFMSIFCLLYIVSVLADAQNATELWSKGCAVILTPRAVNLEDGEVQIDNRWVIVPTGIDAQEISVRSLRRDLTELVSPESEQGSAGRLRYSAFDSGPRVVRLLSYDDWVSLGRGAVIKERQVKRLLRLTTLLAVAVLLAAADRVSVRTGCTSRSR